MVLVRCVKTKKKKTTCFLLVQPKERQQQEEDDLLVQPKERQMENHSGSNVTSDDHNYSSPIPLIGLYTAAATSVCFLFMIFDLLYGLRSRKPWIPCRFFSLNSLTLTLLAIATKLPVDLTTSMPSAHDQLSKLTGTVFICISMGFFFPSVGSQSHYERLSNMASLTIYVIAVVVNVAIQMATRVIFAFIVEHVIILSCMVLLLLALWDSTVRHHLGTDIYLDDVKEQLEKGDPRSSENECMINRIKLFYVSSYGHNPQLFISDTAPATTMGVIPILCTVVLSQAAIRSLILNNTMEFGYGVSDYKWSIWMVVVTQGLTITIGCIAIGFRSLTVVSNTDLEPKHLVRGPNVDYIHIIANLKALRLFVNMNFGVIVWLLETIFVTLLPFCVTVLVTYVVRGSKKCFSKQRNGEATDIVRQEKPYLSGSRLIRWMQKKSQEDVNRLIEKYKIDSPTHLLQLFCKITPSEESLTNRLQVSSENRISCLSVVLLVRMAIVSLPDSLSTSLVHTLDEAFEIIYFIDKTMSAGNLCNKAKWMMAKYMWKKNKCIKSSVKKHCSEVVMRSMDGGFQSQSQLKVLNETLGTIEEIPLQPDMTYFVVRDDVHAINEFIIKCRSWASIDELYGHIEQLFVDMLQFFFSQLSHAILKHIVESPNEQSEERASFALKLLSKVAPFEDKVHWSFPIGTGITSLITPHGQSRDAHRIEQLESNAATHIVLQVAEDCEIQEHA